MPMTNAYHAAHRAPRNFAPELTHHIFLIAIRGEAEEPVVHRGNALHPMQVILTAAGDHPPFPGHEPPIGPLPPLPPQPRRLMQRPHGALMPREVTGEILRDGHGRLYEKLGDYVRPVTQLFTGARGEMIDLAPVRDVTPQPLDGDGGRDDEGGDAIEVDDSSGEASAPEDSAGKSLRELARRLVPEPGIWRLVRYADHVDAISPQLANPRRLQPNHQLPCYAQIHETTVSISVAALEEAASRELGHAGKLLPLSYDLCRRFAISLPRPPLGIAARPAKVPGMVPPGARFLSLRVALDPTADAAKPAAVAPAETAPPAPSAEAARCAVPEEFAKPWDLRHTRDEVLYDMSLAASRGAWQRWVDRFRHRVSSRAMARWQALLSGKSADEQLWSIRPPRGAIADARIRRWVDHTLRLGGYDVDKMRVEWEIHWRRKGL